MYFPLKYFRGLTGTQKARRKGEIASRSKLSWKTQKAYRPFKTDKGVKTKKSQYTIEWTKKFPNALSIPAAARATGVPASLIKQSHDRGIAAWRTGHRPGATKEQWGIARYRSMLLCGKTHYTADADIVRDAKKKSAKARSWFNKTCKNSPVKYKK
jgi:hypothetical protein